MQTKEYLSRNGAWWTPGSHEQGETVGSGNLDGLRRSCQKGDLGNGPVAVDGNDLQRQRIKAVRNQKLSEMAAQDTACCSGLRLPTVKMQWAGVVATCWQI